MLGRIKLMGTPGDDGGATVARIATRSLGRLASSSCCVASVACSCSPTVFPSTLGSSSEPFVSSRRSEKRVRKKKLVDIGKTRQCRPPPLSRRDGKTDRLTSLEHCETLLILARKEADYTSSKLGKELSNWRENSVFIESEPLTTHISFFSRSVLKVCSHFCRCGVLAVFFFLHSKSISSAA